MGTPLSKPVEDWTPEEVATVVEASGTDSAYQDYGDAIRAGGVCGLILTTPAEVEETLDDLPVQAKLHRRVLMKKWQALSGHVVTVQQATPPRGRKRKGGHYTQQASSPNTTNTGRKPRADKGRKCRNRGHRDEAKCVKNFFLEMYHQGDFQCLAPSLPLNTLAQFINDRIYGGDRKNLYKMHRSLNLVDCLWDATTRSHCIHGTFPSEEDARAAFQEMDDWIRRACHVYCGVNPSTVEPNKGRTSALTGVGNLFTKELMQDIQECLPDWAGGGPPPAVNLRDKVLAKETQLGLLLAAQENFSSTGGGGGRPFHYRNKKSRII